MSQSQLIDFTDLMQYLKHLREKLTYHLASPIVGIGVKEEAGFVGKGNVKDKHKGHNGEDGQPLQPSRATRTLVIRSKRKERKQ